MIRKTTFLLLATFLYLCGNAQERHVCGTTPEALKQIDQRLIKNKLTLEKRKKLAIQRNQEDTFIPLKFHMVATNDGQNRASLDDLFDQMCTLNDVFKDLNIQFYLNDGVNFVDNTNILDNPTILAVINQMEGIRDPASVNIYIVRDAQNPMSDRPGNTLGYYTPTNDWIVMEADQLRAGGMTLLHELGHFFSLPHPFNGWESDPYSFTEEGNPAPGISPGGVTTENADGSNCESAGDRICDTPADYLYFSQLNNVDCRYNRVMIDPQGDTLQPDPTLIMGYFLDNCMNRFTPIQAAIMVTDYEAPARDYLRTNSFTGVVEDIPNPMIAPTDIFPVDDGTVASFGEVTLEWPAVEGASAYVINSTIDGFRNVIVEGTSLTVPVEIGSSYSWKIKPINDFNYCANFSPEFGLFRFNVDMASSVPTINSLDEWTVQPNPIKSNTTLILTVRANEAFEADIFIRNVAGSIIRQLPTQAFSTGTHQVSLDTESFGGAGLYILSLENEQGVAQKKVVLLE